VERAFRTIKGPIKVRPVRHRLDRRIRAHLYVCLVAYLLERWLEVKVREGGGEGWAHLTAERILNSVRKGAVQEVGIRGTTIRRWKLANFSPEGQATLERLGLKGEVMQVPPVPTVLSEEYGPGHGRRNVVNSQGGSRRSLSHRRSVPFPWGKSAVSLSEPALLATLDACRHHDLIASERRTKPMAGTFGAMVTYQVLNPTRK
jgi:hypothetical protein